MVEVDCYRVLRWTAKAVLVSVLIAGSERDMWLPLSQVEMSERGSIAGQIAVATMPVWLARAKGIEVA